MLWQEQVTIGEVRAIVHGWEGSGSQSMGHGMSRLDSRSDPIGGSEPSSGSRDSGLGLFFFFF